ncbi:hypothetical protein NKDENANG_01453 [Candidatus Entotheonellaceae bacterium PAL068K]
MRCGLTWLTLLACLLLSGRGTSLAMGTGGFQVVEGSSEIVKRNQATARIQAIRGALRKALEQVVSEFLEPLALAQEPRALKTRLYARAQTYIRSYRVLWEYPDMAQKVYRVGLEVEAAAQEVAREIQTLGLGQPGKERGRLLVLVVEQQLGRTSPSPFGRDGGVVAHVLRTQLQAQGVRTSSLTAEVPWDGQESSALATGRQAGAGVVLVGLGRVEKVRSAVAGMPLQTVHAVVQVQALTTATGERLAQEQAESTAFHTDAILGGTQALEKAATQVADRLASPLRLHQRRYHEAPRAPREGQ